MISHNLLEVEGTPVHVNKNCGNCLTKHPPYLGISGTSLFTHSAIFGHFMGLFGLAGGAPVSPRIGLPY